MNLRLTFSVLAAALIAAAIQGCADFSSRPARVEADYGNSVRHMVRQQIYNRETIDSPAIDPPTQFDGQRAAAVLKAHREDVGKAEDVEKRFRPDIRF